jgi:hypothetical protein
VHEFLHSFVNHYTVYGAKNTSKLPRFYLRVTLLVPAAYFFVMYIIDKIGRNLSINFGSGYTGEIFLDSESMWPTSHATAR